MHLKTWVLVGWALVLTGCSGRATFDRHDAARLVGEVEAALAVFEVPGAALAVVWSDGEYSGGLGLSDPVTDQAVTSDSRFAVASAIKPLVAAWIEAQVSAGTVTWETTLGELWPDLALGDAATLSLIDVVYQRSGYPREDWLWLGRDLSPSALADALRTVLPIAPRGRTFTYHNVLFALALRGLKQRTGRAFPVNPPDVTGHDRALDGRLIPVSESARQPGVMSVVLEAGLSASEAVPMLRALLVAPNLTEGRTVAADWAACCPLGTGVRYGRGLFREQYGGVLIWIHDGYGIGSTAAVMLDPAAGFGLFIAANRSEASEFVHAVRYAALEYAYDLKPTAVAALTAQWARTRDAQFALAGRALPHRPDPALLGEYSGGVQLVAAPSGDMSLLRGVYRWALLPLDEGQAVFASGPLIGQTLDGVCVEGVRRLVSGGAVLAQGGAC
ncbi:MAG: beta-lactamase family protein [Anaerolineae bacterium]|jgi:hypothetical protein|nr:beta-lactamase family protein [Anaerolineae bacterium]